LRECRGLRKAAAHKEQNDAPGASAIGKAVSRLESRLSLKLLQRTTRSIALTGEGETLYIQSSRVLKGLNEAEATISRARTTPRGRLKISVPTVIGR
jgi:DNA-binding transcriptional LysR family regulator